MFVLPFRPRFLEILKIVSVIGFIRVKHEWTVLKREQSRCGNFYAASIYSTISSPSLDSVLVRCKYESKSTPFKVYFLADFGITPVAAIGSICMVGLTSLLRSIGSRRQLSRRRVIPF
jgi:hypothetical protein